MSTLKELMELAEAYARAASELYWEEDQGWREDTLQKLKKAKAKAKRKLETALSTLVGDQS